MFNELKIKFKQLLLLLVGVMLGSTLLAQTSIKKSRILFLLDASSSMTYPWNSQYKRFDVASNILLHIIDSIYTINNEVEFAVRAYGTDHPAQELNCTDTKLEVPFNIQNINQIKTRLKNIKALGSSPIAYSLQQAAVNELNEAGNYDYSIIFITDGGESCNGDICKTYQALLQKKVSIHPYIIGLDKNDQLRTYYDCLGTYIEVNTAEDIQKAIKLIVDANRPILNKPQTLKLATTYSNTPTIKDTVKKKDTIVKINVSPQLKQAFPILQMLSYPYKISLIKFKSAPIAKLGKMKKVTFTFEVEEAPKPKTQKLITDMELLAMNNFPFQKNKSKPLIAKKTSLKKLPPVALHFEKETEKPIIKESIVFPKLAMKMLAINKKASTPILGKIKKFKSFKASLVFEYEEPIQRVTIVLNPLEMFPFALKKSSIKSMIGKKGNLKKTKTSLKFELEERKKEILTYIRAFNYPKRYSYAYKLPDLNPKFPKLGKAIVRFNEDKPKPIVKKDSVNKTPPKLDNGELEFNIETENSDRTGVQVFFKGLNGKTYPNAKPTIDVLDPTTNAKLKSFQRTSEGGAPVIQYIDPGTYNFIVTGYSDLIAKNVVLVPNKLNKVYIKVTEGSLQFRYIGNRTRPIEFNAIVNRRFAAGATILQKCTDKLYYEPGTYYVEINTLPATKFSVDLTFGAIYELQIAEPGQVQITNYNALGKIQLMCELGDQFVVFHMVNVTGHLNQQLLTLQPGRYKAIIPIDPKMPQAGSKTIDFRVSSNKMLELELN
ncbi:MAG: VWA domain-containing protein [Chitinophagaceae bacterium]|nr:VWA domain-containing protein [Chitinophagaceae bacterium]